LAESFLDSVAGALLFRQNYFRQNDYSFCLLGCGFVLGGALRISLSSAIAGGESNYRALAAAL
jgi:hypothetical protein